jgi:hypothetical protein
LKGECLCRRVSVEVPAAPSYINICNCKFCRKSGAAWAYYDDHTITIVGETRQFIRDDIDAWLVAHFCPTCGATTHYTPTAAHQSERTGVNTRLFEQDLLAGIEVRFQDGRNVVDENDRFVVTATGHIGDGSAF